MVTPASRPPVPDYSQLTFEQVFEQVSAADAQTFYRKAYEFERATRLLETVAEQVRRHRRELDEVWTNRDPERFGVFDRLVRHLDELLGRLGDPDYPQLLRRIGDTVVDSQHRLRAMRDNDTANPADAEAGADRDQRARQILTDLSTSYTQFGGSLTELPHHGATGQALPPPPVSHRAPAYPAETNQAFVGTGMDRDQEVPAGAAGLDGAAVPPAGTAPFARFAHYAGRPEPQEEALRPKEFAGFAEMALARDARAVFPVAGVQDRAEAKGDKDKEARPEPVVPGAVTSVVSEPGAVAPGTPRTAPVPTTGGHPGTAAGASSAVAHVTARISGISLPDKVIGVPEGHLTAPSPPVPASGPVPPAVATAAAVPGVPPDGTAGPMPPGAAGGPVAPGVLTGSAQSRVDGVWRRADPDAWQQGDAGVEHLGRQDSGDGKDTR